MSGGIDDSSIDGRYEHWNKPAPPSGSKPKYKKNIMRRDGPMKDSFVIGIEENLEN
jgi:hypothetical protein